MTDVNLAHNTRVLVLAERTFPTMMLAYCLRKLHEAGFDIRVDMFKSLATDLAKVYADPKITAIVRSSVATKATSVVPTILRASGCDNVIQVTAAVCYFILKLAELGRLRPDCGSVLVALALTLEAEEDGPTGTWKLVKADALGAAGRILDAARGELLYL